MQSIERNQLKFKLDNVKAARRVASKTIRALEAEINKPCKGKAKKPTKKKQAELDELKVRICSLKNTRDRLYPVPSMTTLQACIDYVALPPCVVNTFFFLSPQLQVPALYMYTYGP